MKKTMYKKLYTKKLASERGFSLIELLAATLVLILIASALAVGIPAALHAYEKVTATAEATTLLSTLSQSLADELRYARDVEVQSQYDPSLTNFTSAVYGLAVKPVNKDGMIQIEHITIPPSGVPITTTYPLLNEAVYTRNLEARIWNEITYIENVFSLTLQVYLPANTLSTINEDTVLAETELKIRAINN